MLAFKRLHDSGTQATLSQYADGWRVDIELREVAHNPLRIIGYLQPTLERAQLLADQEILKYGHVCSAGCKTWKEC